jgi:hypothetical protein
MKLNYGIVAVLNSDLDKFVSEELDNESFELFLGALQIQHFCGYEAPPTDIEFLSLYHELKNDADHELTNKEFVLLPASKTLVSDIKKEMGVGENHEF